MSLEKFKLMVYTDYIAEYVVNLPLFHNKIEVMFISRFTFSTCMLNRIFSDTAAL